MIIADILLALVIVLLLFAIYMWCKNENTYSNHVLIDTAILMYRLDMIQNHDYSDGSDPTFEVDHEDCEPYGKTLFRLWDWGYKRILPPEKFEIIKPYIDKEEK